MIHQTQELEQVQADRDAAAAELRDKRKELSNMSASRDALRKEVTKVKAVKQREVSKLQVKVKG